MRLLHITHQYRPAIGGAEQYITDISEELARRGHHVDVYTSQSVDYQSWRNELPAYEELDNVHIRRFPAIERRGHTWKALEFGLRNYWQSRSAFYEPLVIYGNGPVCPQMVWQLHRTAHQYDLIHINNLHYAHAPLAFAATYRRRPPLVITPHVHAEQRITYDLEYMQRIFRHSQVVLADTAAEKAFILEEAFNSTVMVAGPGLHLRNFPQLDKATSREKLGIPQDATVLLFLGRKTEYKGLEICLQALAALRQEYPNLYLLALGPETSYSEALWRRYSSTEGLVVRGVVANEERLAAFAACDIYTMPSSGEAFGIVYLEAWAYAKPVIGARITAVASLVRDGDDGFLVEPDNQYQLVAILRRLLNNPAQAITAGRRGYDKLCRRYTVERVTDVVEGAYARAIRHHATARHLAIIA